MHCFNVCRICHLGFICLAVVRKLDPYRIAVIRDLRDRSAEEFAHIPITEFLCHINFPQGIEIVIGIHILLDTDLRAEILKCCTKVRFTPFSHLCSFVGIIYIRCLCRIICLKIEVYPSHFCTFFVQEGHDSLLAVVFVVYCYKFEIFQ